MKPVNQDSAKIEWAGSSEGSARTLMFSGPWTNASLGPVISQLDSVTGENAQGDVALDISGISTMDMAGAWLVRRISIGFAQRGQKASLAGGSDTMIELIEELPDEVPKPAPAAPRPPIFERLFSPLGRMTVDLWDDVLAMLYVIGSAVRGAQTKINRGSGISPAAVVNQLDHMGVRAVPIITLMSFLIGAIIAQQGAFQLRYFGAEIFVVDLVGILQLREIGVLLTAIMIAGRSGSAITAEIGSMKMREEIDALKVIGLNPIGVLVFPRLVALTIALPLLTIIANFAALCGAAVVSNIYSGITYSVFLSRLHEAIDYSTLASGMIKAPFMALIIGVVAAVEGMKVGGSAESLGFHVTSSVVKSIFVVILVDALFAIFYSAIDF